MNVVRISYEEVPSSNGKYKVMLTGRGSGEATLYDAERVYTFVRGLKPETIQITKEAEERLGEDVVSRLRLLVE